MLQEILSKKEGKTLEFKQGTQSLTGIVKTIIAFANSSGGILVIGIEDKTKKIIGLNNVLEQEERLSKVIHTSIEPLLMPDIEVQTYKKKELIIITVPHATGPYHLKSAGTEKGTYIRLGSTNRLADGAKIQELKNFAHNIVFDELPMIQAKKSDIDWQLVKQLFKEEINKKISPDTAQSLGLTTYHNTKEVPTRGGIILFGINRRTLFPEAIIRCARFSGDTKNVIIDQADIDSYLPLALQEAIKFVKKHTRLGSVIQGLAPRKDIPQYPPAAVREAIMNAIVHADYSLQGIYISIAIFDERIEITNPGGLPFGVTIEKALTGTSRIRNRVLAKVFYQLKWIEQWGHGLQRIVQECAEHGLAEPKFEELNNQFRVTLSTRKKEKKSLSSTNDWNHEFIKHLTKQEKISTKEAAAFWHITPRAALNRLKKLTQSGAIKKTGMSLKDPQSKYVPITRIKK